MKTKRNHISAQLGQRPDIDAEISAMLARELPSANSNPWFTPRVMNRLPEQSRWARVSLWQWICYLLSFVGVIAAVTLSARWLIHTEFTITTLLTVVFISLLIITCAGVMMVPSLVRILREP